MGKKSIFCNKTLMGSGAFVLMFHCPSIRGERNIGVFSSLLLVAEVLSIYVDTALVKVRGPCFQAPKPDLYFLSSIVLTQ